MATKTASGLEIGGGVMSKTVGTAVVLTILAMVVKHPSDAADFVSTVLDWIDQIATCLPGVRWLARADVRLDNLEEFVDLVQRLQRFGEVVPTDQRFTATWSIQTGAPRRHRSSRAAAPTPCSSPRGPSQPPARRR